jgi:hypothetical protein
MVMTQLYSLDLPEGYKNSGGTSLIIFTGREYR